MAIYNYNYIMEMKSKEEYRRDSFKKKYNYKPDINNKDKGYIRTNGKSYRIDIDMKNKSTCADLQNKNSKIMLGKDFFKLKGSNHNERRDAVLQHEIGHQNLHNIHPQNLTTDIKNRTEKVVDTIIKNNEKKKGINFDSLPKEEKENKFKEYDRNKCLTYLANDEDKNRRNKSLEFARKYETNDKHSNAEEFEADRYSANKTSESSLKKGLRNINKINSKNSNDNKERTEDYLQRSKALKDKNMRNSEVYK